MTNEKKLTSQFDYALRRLGATGNEKYNKRMNDIEEYAKTLGYEGKWARNRYGNNKMLRFSKIR
jgi:hypothetical protein